MTSAERGTQGARTRSPVCVRCWLAAGLRVNTIAVDRMVPFTVYVGTNRGVYRGASTNRATWIWRTYNRGLPLADVNHLELHPTSGQNGRGHIWAQRLRGLH
jgi:hypothetical protein